VPVDPVCGIELEENLAVSIREIQALDWSKKLR